MSTGKFRKSLIVAVVLAVGSARAQDVTVEARSDSSHITIGDWFTVAVDVKRPVGTTVIWPSLVDSIGGFSVMKKDSIPAESSGEFVRESRILTLTRFDEGAFAVPSIPVIYRNAGDSTVRYAYSLPISITVEGVAIDTAAGIKDIKPPLDVPLTWKEILLYAGIVLVLGAVGYGLYYYFRKKKTTVADIMEEARPRIPPHVRAITLLKELEERHLWQQGEVKQFHSEATEILRQYFEERFAFLALEMTTPEILDHLRRDGVNGEALSITTSLLMIADLVKFAKYSPVSAENETVVPHALQVVELTTPAEVPVADA